MLISKSRANATESVRAFAEYIASIWTTCDICLVYLIVYERFLIHETMATEIENADAPYYVYPFRTSL